jgi:HD-like signal output (HDOD) protein
MRPGIYFAGYESSATAVIAPKQPSDFDFPHLPVLPETLLLLELKAQDRWIDITEVARIVRRDLGATIQVLRMAGSTSASSDIHAVRIEECIAEVGLDACIAGLSCRGSNSECVSALWAHCREIAEQAELIADEIPDTDPAEVYLVGLLHAIYALPGLLGWTADADKERDSAAIGLALAEMWSLPSCVQDLFSARAGASNADRWTRILSKAHQRANSSFRSEHCLDYE